MRAIITLLIVLALMGCKKAHGPGDGRTSIPKNVEAVDQKIAVVEQEASQQATEEGLPQLGSQWAFGGLYRASDHETGVVCYVVNAHPSAISCVVPTTFPTEETP